MKKIRQRRIPQLNKTKNIFKLILIFIVSLLTAAAAGYGILKCRKPGKTAGKKPAGKAKEKPSVSLAESGPEKTVAAGTEESVESGPGIGDLGKNEPEQPVMIRSAKPENSYAAGTVKPDKRHKTPAHKKHVHKKHARRKHISKKRSKNKKRSGKIFFALAAALLVVVTAGYGILQRMELITAMAKESFSGIGKIVEEHDEDNPYIILDIVPSDAYYDEAKVDADGNVSYKRYSFSTGTIGYLAGGQTTLAQDFKTVFDDHLAYYKYENRLDLYTSVISSQFAVDSFPGIKYEEAYGGVHGNPSAADGWTLLFESQEVDSNNLNGINYANISEGIFEGIYQKKQSGEDSNGYDFMPKSAIAGNSLLNAGMYQSNPADGDLHVIFSQVSDLSDLTELYVVDSADEYDLGSYSDTTGLYLLDEGKYCYVGTVAQIVYGRSDSSSGGNKNGDGNSIGTGSESIGDGSNTVIEGESDGADSDTVTEGENSGDGSVTEGDGTDNESNAGTEGEGGSDGSNAGTESEGGSEGSNAGTESEDGSEDSNIGTESEGNGDGGSNGTVGENSGDGGSTGTEGEGGAESGTGNEGGDNSNNSSEGTAGEPQRESAGVTLVLWKIR